jgi:hypothetical protein
MLAALSTSSHLPLPPPFLLQKTFIISRFSMNALAGYPCGARLPTPPYLTPSAHNPSRACPRAAKKKSAARDGYAALTAL